MKRSENTDVSSTFLYKSQEKSPSKDEMSAVKSFFSENMKVVPSGRLIKQGEGISLLPGAVPMPTRSVFMAGVMVGELKGKVFLPHHQFFSAYGKDFIRQENLKAGDGRIEKYLRGEEIESVECKGSGYVAILYEGAPLGGGKASSGRIKNHYPKGIRNK
jgi:NOL1/NOP2/fmu family ribosome biogenesis protein